MQQKFLRYDKKFRVFYPWRLSDPPLVKKRFNMKFDFFPEYFGGGLSPNFVILVFWGVPHYPLIYATADHWFRQTSDTGIPSIPTDHRYRHTTDTAPTTINFRPLITALNDTSRRLMPANYRYRQTTDNDKPSIRAYHQYQQTNRFWSGKKWRKVLISHTLIITVRKLGSILKKSSLRIYAHIKSTKCENLGGRIFLSKNFLAYRLQNFFKATKFISIEEFFCHVEEFLGAIIYPKNVSKRCRFAGEP